MSDSEKNFNENKEDSKTNEKPILTNEKDKETVDLKLTPPPKPRDLSVLRSSGSSNRKPVRSPNQERTVWITSMPPNVGDTEAFNLVRWLDGYVSHSFVREKDHAMMYVLFKTTEEALKCVERLNGVEYTPYSCGSPYLKAKLSQTNLKPKVLPKTKAEVNRYIKPSKDASKKDGSTESAKKRIYQGDHFGSPDKTNNFNQPEQINSRRFQRQAKVGQFGNSFGNNKGSYRRVAQSGSDNLASVEPFNNSGSTRGFYSKDRQFHGGNYDQPRNRGPGRGNFGNGRFDMRRGMSKLRIQKRIFDNQGNDLSVKFIQSRYSTKTKTKPCSTIYLRGIPLECEYQTIEEVFNSMPNVRRFRLHSRDAGWQVFIDYHRVEDAIEMRRWFDGKSLAIFPTFKGINADFATEKMRFDEANEKAMDS